MKKMHAIISMFFFDGIFILIFFYKNEGNLERNSNKNIKTVFFI